MVCQGVIPRKKWRLINLSGHFSRLLVVNALLICLLQEGEALLQKNGRFYMCAASPEQVALHVARRISGGVNTLHAVEREPCDRRTVEERRYRTYDGTCNARLDLGAAFSPVKRLAPHYYEGQDSKPREHSVTGRRLPSGRAVSLAVHTAREVETSFSLMLMQFGQLLDHDVTLMPVATDVDDSIRCCNVPLHLRSSLCFPIENPDYDTEFGRCSEFVRSEPLILPNGTIPNPRQHTNAVTAFVDASIVYGSDRRKAKSLRTNNGTGALLMTSRYKDQERLPRGDQEECVNVQSSHYCSTAGDERANEQPALTSLHLVFHLEHNRLVRKLVKALLFRTGRPFSSFHVDQYIEHAPPKIQERLYQTVRKIVGAVWQRIVYNEYLPLVLGPRLMDEYHLWPGRFVPLDPLVDPSVSIEFSSAAFRYGHTLINDFIMTDRRHLLRDVFSTSSHYLDNFKKVIEGLVSWRNYAETYDPNMPKSITSHLFANTNDNVGLDLAAMNIQRGRDHAIPSYNEMREHMGLRRKRSWRDFGSCGESLQRVYAHPDDVDLFTGGTCESSMERGVVGELFGHIIARQFQDLKFGDKHFYETESSFNGFSWNELRAINRMTLSKVLCENAQLEAIQEDPFRHPDRQSNPVYKCSAYRDVDLWWWTYYIM